MGHAGGEFKANEALPGGLGGEVGGAGDGNHGIFEHGNDCPVLVARVAEGDGGEFTIAGKAEWWNAVFSNRIDAFLATQQGKLTLQRGELAQLSRWYKPFQRAFAIWQTIPVQ